MDLDRDNAKAQAEIRDYLTKNASLATYFGDKAKDQGYDVTSLGANASIGQVELVDSTGALDMVSNEDPYVTASKLEYAEHGIEPLGVLRAALEAWAYNAKLTRRAMRRRVAAATSDWDDIIITSIYKNFLSLTGSDTLRPILKQWADLAAAFSEMKSDAHCQVSEVAPWVNAGGWENEIDVLIAGLMHSTQWNANKQLELVMKQVMAGTFPSSAPWYKSITDLLEANFTAKSAMVTGDKYVDIGFLNGRGILAPMLAGPSSKGKTILALIALLDGGAPTSAKAYITKRVNPGAPEIPELPEVPEVPEIKEQLAPRAMVPKVPAAPGRAKVAKIEDKRAAAPAIPKLEELPELAEVKAGTAEGPMNVGETQRPSVMAPGRKGRPKRDLIPKVPAVKPFLLTRYDIPTLVAKRATEDEIIAKAK